MLDRSHPLAKGLVAAFPLNEGAGKTVHDLAAPGRTGTLAAGASWVTTPIGVAVHPSQVLNEFNSFSSNIVTASSTLQSFEMWYLHVATANFASVLVNDGGQYGYAVNANGLDIDGTGGVQGSVMTAGAVYHAVYTMTSTTSGTIYKNAVQDATGNAGFTLPSTYDHWAGDNAGEQMPGTLIAWRLWDGRSLTASEVAALYADPWAMYTPVVERLRTFAILATPPSSGTTTNTLTVSDSATAADSLGTALGLTTGTDSPTAADSTTASALEATGTDAATTADSLGTNLGAQTQTDAPTVGETLVQAGSSSLSSTDASTLADSAASSALGTGATDSATTTDSLGTGVGGQTQTDSGTLTETLAATGLGSATTDALTGADSTSQASVAAPTDAPTVTETSTLAGKANDTFTDPLTGGDSVVFPGGTTTNPITLSDSLTVGDNLPSVGSGLTQGDTGAGLGESLGTGVGAATLTDAPTVGETLVQAGQSSLSATDTLLIGEVAALLSALVPAADALSVAETAGVLVGSAALQDLLVAAEALVWGYTSSANEPVLGSSETLTLTPVAVTGAPVAAPNVLVATALLPQLLASVRGNLAPFAATVSVPASAVTCAVGGNTGAALAATVGVRVLTCTCAK